MRFYILRWWRDLMKLNISYDYGTLIRRIKQHVSLRILIITNEYTLVRLVNVGLIRNMNPTFTTKHLKITNMWFYSIPFFPMG